MITMSHADPRENAESDTTGFPGLRSWRAVYGLVVAIFVIWVALLLALQRAYS
jgi:hypothetical protein